MNLRTSSAKLLGLALLLAACATPRNANRSQALRLCAHDSGKNYQTAFLNHAVLNDTELGEVIDLAKRCGIPDVAKIETNLCLPTTTLGIEVTSSARVSGKTIRYAQLSIDRMGWSSNKPTRTAIRLGEFWCDSPVIVLRFRVVTIRRSDYRVQLLDGVSPELADQVIPEILLKRVQIGEKDAPILRQIAFSKMNSFVLERRPEDGYALRCSGPKWPGFSVSFQFVNRRVVITGIARVTRYARMTEQWDHSA